MTRQRPSEADGTVDPQFPLTRKSTGSSIESRQEFLKGRGGARTVPKRPPLSQTHPELAAEAMFDATTVMAGSNKKMPWKCTDHGHEWETSVAHRSREGTGCPVCSNQRTLAGFNDLQTTHPDIAREAVFDPTTITAGSNKKMPWKCAAHGHEWEAFVAHRTRSKSGCPICTNNVVLAGFNDLQTTHPDIAQEADLNPTTVIAGSGKKITWKCAAHGHKWETSVEKRTGSDKTGCPFCSNKRVLAGFNDLHTTHPELAAEAMFDPTTVVAGSNKKMPWKCAAHGHEWNAQVNSRYGPEGSGCPVCTNQKVLTGFNDLQTTHPDIAREAVFDPTTITAGSAEKVWWKCTDHAHAWKTSVVKRSREGTGCPVCSNQKVLTGFNDLQTKYPDIAREAAFDPTVVPFRSGKKMSWKCTDYGHEWEATVNHRTGVAGTTCPVCSSQKVLAGFNDLQTTHPDIAREAVFDPTTIMAGSNKKMPWKCAAHGHEWEAVAGDRTGVNKNGCPVCAETGFNPGAPAWLYLMRHPEWFLQQIGITNRIEGRLKKHESNGWEVLDIRGPMDGYLTQDWEVSILRWLSSCSIPRAASGTDESPHFDTPNSGEAWQQSDLNVTSVREIMDLVEADEQ